MNKINQADMLINAIDKRIEDYFTNSKVVCQYIGKVISVNGDQTANVQLMGYSTIFRFPYRTYLTKLSQDDTVLIQSKIGNLSNGIIVDTYYGGN